MINKITIQNFKSIKDKVEIDLKPITLLFGPNSAGKSTVVQALHYIKEILERNNTDPGTTKLGGDAIDLGGFANLVHREDGDANDHYKNTDIILGVEIGESELIEPELFDRKKDFKNSELLLQNAGYEPYLLEFTIKWDESISKPIVKKYKVSIGGEEIGHIEMDGWNIDDMENLESSFPHPIDQLRLQADFSNNGPKPKFKLTKLNFGHPSLNWLNETTFGKEKPTVLFEELFDGLPGAIVDKDKGETDLFLYNNFGAFPLFKPITLSGPYTPKKWELMNDPESSDHDPTIEFGSIELTLSHIFSTPIIMLKDALTHFRYIGPLRTIPERVFDPENYPIESRWSDGLGAWDTLLQRYDSNIERNKNFIRNVNHWMEKLDTGYSIKVKNFKEIDEDSPLRMGLNKQGRIIEDGQEIRNAFDQIPTQSKLCLIEEKNQIEVSAKDIGSGIAQVLPIIVAAVDKEGGYILSVEQPELHIHPAIQQRLADMVITETSKVRQIILETHSEHIMLRLLRRIEETTENELENPALELKPEDVSVVYVEPTGKGVEMTQLPIDETGEFTRHWPRGFFEERSEDLI